MNKQQEHLNAISSLQGRLTKENKAYMRKLHAYLILESAFHEQEERATELLLSIKMSWRPKQMVSQQRNS